MEVKEDGLAGLAAKRYALLLGMGMVLLVLGAKLGLIHAYGTDQPFADQWVAEGAGFLQAPLHGDLNWASFFWPHGEHRPAVTRLITRTLIVGNGGRWDCYVEIVFNLTIYAALLLVAWRIVCRVARGWMLAIAAVLMAVLFSAPCAYENLLWGFQSQFIFLLFTGLFHIYGTLRSGRVDGVWCFAQFIGLCGLFSIAAGVMSAAVLVAVAVLEICRGHRNAWAWCTFGVNSTLLAYGLWLLPVAIASSGSNPGHLLEAASRVGYLLSWPMHHVGWVVLFQAPCVGLLCLWLIYPKDRGWDRLVAILGVWIVAVLFAIAYGRNLTPDTIGVRYFDVLLTGMFVNGVGLLGMLGLHRGRFVGAWRVLAAIWLAVTGAAFWSLNNPTHSGAMLREQKARALEQKDVVVKFISSGDVAMLEEFDSRTHRFPHFAATVALLQDKTVLPYLPPSLSTDSRIGPLSRLAPLISGSWRLWMGIGLALWVIAVWRERETCRDWD